MRRPRTTSEELVAGWRVDVEGERDSGGDGDGGLEEEDEWGGEGEGWRVRVLNAGVIAESSERVQWHSMSPWSYCMTHSTQRQRHTPVSLSQLTA